MSDEDFESTEYLAGCVQRIEGNIEEVRASETIWAGNIPVLQQGLAIARKELAGFLASVVVKSAREVRIAERKKWIAGRREGRRLRMGSIIDAYLEAECAKNEANTPRSCAFLVGTESRSITRETCHGNYSIRRLLRQRGTGGICRVLMASRRRVCSVALRWYAVERRPQRGASIGGGLDVLNSIS